MAPPVILAAETWSVGSGTYLVNLDLFYALTLLLLILVLLSCGNCKRQSAQFSADSNETENKDSSQLIRVTHLNDAEYPKVICKPTLKEGSLHSRKVSWQNDINETASLSQGPALNQQTRALPDIPSHSDWKEDSEGKGDPVYQTASDLTTPCRHMEEELMEPPYAASTQFTLEAPKAEMVEDETGGEETGKSGTASEKVTAVYARVSKKLKTTSSLESPGPSSPPESEQFEEQPPPIPEKLFDDEDIVVGESPGNQSSKQSGCQTTTDPSPDNWVSVEAGADAGVRADPVLIGGSG